MRPSNKTIRSFASRNDESEPISSENKSLTQAKRLLEKHRNNSKIGLGLDANLTNSSNLVCFSVALNEIIAKIEYAKPVFIECIKPNENSFSTQFVASVAAKQIRELGLIEYARVRKLNYPVKIDFGLFLKRFEKLGRSYGVNSIGAANAKEACIHVLQMSAIRNYRVGINKVRFSNRFYMFIKLFDLLLLFYRCS